MGCKRRIDDRLLIGTRSSLSRNTSLLPATTTKKNRTQKKVNQKLGEAYLTTAAVARDFTIRKKKGFDLLFGVVGI